MRNVVITVVAVVLIMVSFLAGARVSYSNSETQNVPETTSAPVEMGTPVYITKCTKVVAYKYCSEYTTYKVREH